MNQIFASLFICLVLVSCKLNTKIKPPYEFKIIDTEMAELKADPEPKIEILQKDSTEFLKFWESFFNYYQQNDTAQLIRLSLDSVKTSLYNEITQAFQPETAFISIFDFLRAPQIKRPFTQIIPYSKMYPFFIKYRYSYNADTQNKKSKRDSVLLNYYVLLFDKEKRGNYEFTRSYSFSFMKINGRIRFTGQEIQGESFPQPINDSITRANLYFPLYRESQDSLMNANSLDTFINLWHSAYLSTFKEPYLYNYKSENEIYRFTWLRAFHNLVVIRFQKQGDDFILTTKVLEDNGAGFPDKLIVNTTQYLTQSEWNKWIFKLGRLNFWNMPALDLEPRGTDGAEWILEGNNKGKYYFVTRSSSEPAYKGCCKYLIELSRLKIPKEAIY